MIRVQVWKRKSPVLFSLSGKLKSENFYSSKNSIENFITMCHLNFKFTVHIIKIILMFLMILNSPVGGLDFETGKSLLNQKVLKTLIYDQPPGLVIKKLATGNYSYDGFVMEMLGWMKQYFNLTFDFVHLNLSEVTRFGHEELMLRKLETREVDFLPFFIETCLKNLKVIEFMQPLLMSDLLMLQPFPYEESRISTPVKPFTSKVWIYFIGSTLLFISVLSTFAYLDGLERNNLFSHMVFKAYLASLLDVAHSKPAFWEIIVSQTEYVITIIAGQGNYIRYTARTALRILLAAWLLSMVVLVYAYTGVFTSILTVPKLEPIVSTVDELAKSHRFRLTAENNSAMTNQLLEAISGPYKIFGDQLRKDPQLLYGDYYQAVDNIVHKDAVLMTVISYKASLFIKFAINEDTKANGKCRLTSSSTPLLKTLPLQLGLIKGSPYAKVFDEQFSLRLMAHGMDSYIINKYVPSTSQCQPDVNPNGKNPVAVKLLDFAGLFVLLFVGWVISLFILVVEKLNFKICQDK